MTLTESCLGLAIVSTITMIAVPSLLRSQETYVLNAASREVAANMHSARINAVARNRDCRLRVTSEVSYVVECQDSVWIPVTYAVTPRGIHIAANARPEFHRHGNVSPTGTITLSDSNGGRRKVIVNNAGRVRVQ